MTTDHIFSLLREKKITLTMEHTESSMKNKTFINKKFLKNTPSIYEVETKLKRVFVVDNRMTQEQQEEVLSKEMEKTIEDISNSLNLGFSYNFKTKKIDLEKSCFESLADKEITYAALDYFSKPKNEELLDMNKIFSGIKNDDLFILNEKSRREDAALSIQKSLYALKRKLETLKFIPTSKEKDEFWLRYNYNNVIFVSLLNPDDLDFIKQLDISSENENEYEVRQSSNIKCDYTFCEIISVQENVKVVNPLSAFLIKEGFRFTEDCQTTMRKFTVNSLSMINALGPAIIV